MGKFNQAITQRSLTCSKTQRRQTAKINVCLGTKRLPPHVVKETSHPPSELLTVGKRRQSYFPSKWAQFKQEVPSPCAIHPRKSPLGFWLISAALGASHFGHLIQTIIFCLSLPLIFILTRGHLKGKWCHKRLLASGNQRSRWDVDRDSLLACFTEAIRWACSHFLSPFSLLPFCFLSSPSPSSSLRLFEEGLGEGGLVITLTIMNVSSYKWEWQFCWVKKNRIVYQQARVSISGFATGLCVILGSWASAGSLLKHRVRLMALRAPRGSNIPGLHPAVWHKSQET